MTGPRKGQGASPAAPAAFGRRGDIQGAQANLREHFPEYARDGVAAFLDASTVELDFADQVKTLAEARDRRDRALRQLAKSRGVTRSVTPGNPALRVVGSDEGKAEREYRQALKDVEEAAQELEAEAHTHSRTLAEHLAPGVGNQFNDEFVADTTGKRTWKSLLVLAGWLVDVAEVGRRFAEWRAMDIERGYTSPAGRKSLISPRTMTILELARTMADSDVTYRLLAKDVMELAADSSDEGERLREYIGLKFDEGMVRKPNESRATVLSRLQSRIARTWGTRCGMFDPFPGNRGQRTAEEQAAYEYLWKKDPVRFNELLDRMDEFAQAITDSTLWLVDDTTWARWREAPAVSVDGTFVGTVWQQRKRKRTVVRGGREVEVEFAGSDPEAAVWARSKVDHRAPEGAQVDGEEYKYGFEATVAVMGGRDLETREQIPSIALGMVLRKPALGQADALRRLADSTAEVLEGQRALLCTDRGFLGRFDAKPDTKAEAKTARADWHRHLRKNFDFSMSYSLSAMGPKVTQDKAVFIEGNWYCTSMPDWLKTASQDHFGRVPKGKERLSEEDYAKALAQREAYLLRYQQAPTGDKFFLVCPAADPGATVSCSNRPHPKRRRGLPIIFDTEGPGGLCAAKSKKTIYGTFETDKFTQFYRFGTHEWAAHYRHGRNRVEAWNNTAKERGNQGIENGRNRRRKGMAAASFFVALRVAATNFRVMARHREKLTDTVDMTQPPPPAPPSGPPALTDDLRAALTSLHNDPDGPAEEPWVRPEAA